MVEELSTLIDLFTRPEFLAGLGSGLVALILVLVFVPADTGRGWGIAVVAATLVGVQLAVGQRVGLMAGLVALIVGGWILEDRRLGGKQASVGAAVVSISLGVLLVTFRSGLPDTRWVILAAAPLIVALGWSMGKWPNSSERHLIGILFLATAFGIWSTVPETNTARVLLGVALPTALISHRGVGAGLTSAGSYALAGLVVWVGATGGAERPGSIIGAWACLGLLALWPLLDAKLGGIRGWTAVGAHLLWVILSARVFGLWETAVSALVGVISLAGVAALSYKAWPTNPREPRQAER